MKFPEASSRVQFPAIISISHETAFLLKNMADEMSVSLDELISGIAEDSVTGLQSSDLINGVSIPDSSNTKDLQRYLEK